MGNVALRTGIPVQLERHNHLPPRLSSASDPDEHYQIMHSLRRVANRRPSFREFEMRMTPNGSTVWQGVYRAPPSVVPYRKAWAA